MERTVLVKAFALLESLGDARDGLPLRNLASVAGVTRPTAHRILATLAGLGYVRNAGAGVYRIAVDWPASKRPDTATLLAAAGPVVQRLNRQTGETINLGTLRGTRVEYLVVVESRHPLRRVVRAGDTDPFHSTALGRAIAAFLPTRQRDALLRRAPRPGTLRRALVETARIGYAIEQDETDVGVSCLGAPIFTTDRVVAALSISAPSARAGATRRARWLRLLRPAAREISDQLRET